MLTVAVASYTFADTTV